MEILARQISRELETQEHCAIYEPELTRVWPRKEGRRAHIAGFAEEHGWRLRYYSEHVVAIFDKNPK